MSRTGGRFSRGSRRGFTLIELLVVIAIGALLMAVSMASLGGMRGGAKFTASVSALTGYLESGRQRAIGANTYVWILFAPANPSRKDGEVSVVLYERRDGNSTPATAGDVIGTEGETWSPSLKTLSLQQVELKDKGELSFSSLPQETSLIGLAPVSVTVVHAGRSTTYTQGLLFAPNGTARVSSTFSRYVEFGMIPVGMPKNGTVIRVNALTGKPWVYRP
ncbi:prepilin-type N-terminal cleavage/methylation domain-containing protein [Verrucomicrobium sp. GAS474]|uniref:prepilin-type N-terminal cleavage/methylation domain-containing protein n=1 Tax=Verrucomicrobium sp. GAS474 TaxID=1882831 RepID=UPI00087B9DB3|nr:prepilin-type N-terminal cleavage/methylation domain-containing protein [Verrucomicrobium sp. GAS474]SDU11676.1 prepilin-type N-terminal cleavage/methylation domain-containing protein [Verrucomicrobium sp. GAS474]